MDPQEAAGFFEEPASGLSHQLNNGQAHEPQFLPQQNQVISGQAENDFNPNQCDDDQNDNMPRQPQELWPKLRNWEWEPVPEILEKFKNSGAATDVWKELIDTNSEGYNALHFIIAEGPKRNAPIGPNYSHFQNVENLEELRIKMVKSLLNALPAERRQEAVETRNLHGFTALALAIKYRTASMIDYLIIKEGANVDTQDEYGKTPLRYTAEDLDSDIARLLLNHNANPLIYDNCLTSTIDELKFKCTHSRETAAKGLLELMQQTPAYIPTEPSASVMARCFAVSGFYRGHDNMNHMTYSMPGVPLGEIFRGPIFDEICRRKSLAGPAPWLSCWIHLPENNLSMVTDAVQGLLKSNPAVKDDTAQWKLGAMLEFIDWMRDSKSLTRPGVYYPDSRDIARSFAAEMHCIVLPVLDLNSWSQMNSYSDCEQPDHQTRHLHQQRRLSRRGERQHRDDAIASPAQALEQTLDKYCHDFLDVKLVNARNSDQVIRRYFKHSKNKLSEELLHTEAAKINEAVEAAKDAEEILVVSRLWIWKLGGRSEPLPHRRLRNRIILLTIEDVVITCYGGGRDRKASTRSDLPSRIFMRLSAMAVLASAPDATSMILRSILEECVMHEPCLSEYYGKTRILDGAGAFASEIAHESNLVTEAYKRYKDSLGKIDRSFEESILHETEILLDLDDILSEISMIRRVQEDIRVTCKDYCDNRHDDFKVNDWAERGKTKLQRLQDDAARVRQSLVTLLSLQQREVNTESLINSDLQNAAIMGFKPDGP